MARLCSRLPWVSITPFGAAVEPEVYCRKASVWAPTGGRRHLPAGSLPSSVTNQRSDFISGADADRRSSLDKMWVVVSAAVAFESATIARSRDMDRLSRGGYAGTATTPAYRQPRKAATYLRPGG